MNNNLPEKIPEIAEAQAEIDALDAELTAFLQKVQAGERFVPGKPNALSLARIMKATENAVNRMTMNENAQAVYERMKEIAQESIEKRAQATYAEALLTRFRLMESTLIKDIRQLSSDTGSIQLTRISKMARDAGVPDSLVDAVMAETTSASQRIREAIQAESESKEGVA